MTKIISSIILLFILLACKGEKTTVNTLDKELQMTVNTYVSDAVNHFSEEIESEGGFFMWKNYRDYLTLGQVTFKEKLHTAWGKSFDNEILQLYINTSLTKNYKGKAVTISKNVTDIDAYFYVLLFPFVTFAFEELLILLILFIFVEFFIIPYVAKRTLVQEHSSKGFFWGLLVSWYYERDRQSRIRKRVAEIRKSVNWVLIIVSVVFTVFYFDFNDSLNEKLKHKISADITENILLQIQNNNLK